MSAAVGRRPRRADHTEQFRSPVLCREIRARSPRRPLRRQQVPRLCGSGRPRLPLPTQRSRPGWVPRPGSFPRRARAAEQHGSRTQQAL